MIFLLDTNLLIALCDPNHTQHQAAHHWFSQGKRKWATCPITENGFVRITSHSSYPGRAGDASLSLGILREFCKLPSHCFWPDDITLRDLTMADSRLQSRQITDLYLLALARRHEAKLATFDRRIPISLVAGGDTALERVG